MQKNGDYEVSDVPRLLQQYRDSGNSRVGCALGARAALMDACEALMSGAEQESRALTADERRRFDLHSAQLRSINADLAEYKRKRIEGLAAAGIDASEARFSY